MEKLSDVLKYYRQDKLAVLLRNLADSTDTVAALMLPDGDYPSDDPNFQDLDTALDSQERLIVALVEAYSAIENEAAAPAD
jgi:hypothetical protein